MHYFKNVVVVLRMSLTQDEFYTRIYGGMLADKSHVSSLVLYLLADKSHVSSLGLYLLADLSLIHI